MSLMNEALRKKSRETDRPVELPGMSVTDSNVRNKNKKRIILLATAVFVTISTLAGAYLIRMTSNSILGASQIPPELLLEPLNNTTGSSLGGPKEILSEPVRDVKDNPVASKQAVRPVDVPDAPRQGSELANQSSVLVLEQTNVSKEGVSDALTSEVSARKEGMDEADLSIATSLHAALHSKKVPENSAEHRRTREAKKKSYREKQTLNSFQPDTTDPGRDSLQEHREKTWSSCKNDDFSKSRSQENNPFYLKALAYHRSGRLTDAVRIYQKVLQFDSDHQGAMLNLAAVYIEQGSFHKARMLLNKLELSSSRPKGVLLNLAIAAIGADDLKQALDYLKRAQEESDATLYDIQLHRAVAYSRLDRLPEALTLYQKILEGHPDDTSVRFNLAVTCDALGLYPKALTHYEDVLQASSDIDKRSIQLRMQTIGRHLNTKQDRFVR